MSRTDDDRIRAWLESSAVPLAGDDPDTPPADLAPLRGWLENVSVVGLGESTHGTREFFRIRHRLTAFLIEELGFNTVALEASYGAVERLNAYLSGADADVRGLLADLHLMWNIEEFVSTIEWVRSHNAHTPERMVQFLGLDIFDTKAGRRWLTPYVRRAFPHRSAAIEEIFRDLEAAESGGWLTAHEHAHLEAFDELGELLDEIDDTDSDAEEARRQLRVIQQWVSALILQWVDARLKESLPPLVPTLTPFGVLARTHYLADNLASFRDQHPDAKIAVWAHNLHVAKRYEDADFAPMLTMGHYLAERYGPAYYSVGLEMASGRYRAREWSSERGAFGSLVTPEVPTPPPTGSLPWYFASVGHPQYFVDLREAREPSSAAALLASPLQMHGMGAAYMDPPLLYTQMTPALGFDGMIFVHDTTPTTPTPEALASTA